MPQRELFVATEILVFDFELFIGVLFQGTKDDNYVKLLALKFISAVSGDYGLTTRLWMRMSSIRPEK